MSVACKEYFLERRVWFYGLYFFANGLDMIDSYLKGGMSYLLDEVGVFGWGLTVAAIPVCIIGMRTRNMTFHNYAGVVIMLWQFLLVLVRSRHWLSDRGVSRISAVQLPFSKHSGRINRQSRKLCATGDGTSVVQRKRATR